MNIRHLVVSLAIFSLATIAAAEEHAQMKIVIAATDESGDDVQLEFDSAVQGFNLHDMQVGENRAIVDESGRNVLVTRELDGFRFDIDGKTIEMPLPGRGPHDAVWMSDGNHEMDEIHMMHGSGMAKAHSLEGTMIITEKPVDAATQQAIRSLLEAAGHGNEIRFIGAADGPGKVHKIKVVEKKVEATQ